MKNRKFITMQVLFMAAIVILAFPTRILPPANAISTRSMGIPDEFCFSPKPNVFVPDNYSTIQTAINNANEGDVIFVRAGTYNETLLIYKNITLIGDATETIIAGGVGKPVNVTTVVSIFHSGVKIMSFTIGNGEIGVLARPVNATSISDVGVYGNRFVSITQEAIHLEACSNSVVQGNTIEGSPVGVSCVGGSDNSIESNKLIDNAVAIDVAGTRDRIRRNFISGGVTGIRLANGTGDLLESNSIVNALGNSIQLAHTQGTIVNGNEIHGAQAGTCGIALNYCDNGNFMRNQVEGMKQAGILLEHSQSNILQETETIGNSLGISLVMSPGNHILKAKASGNRNGLAFENSDSNFLFNSVVRNSESGIVLDHSNGVSLSFNLILKNTIGVAVEASNGLIFDTNFLQANGLGISSSDSNSGEIKHSLFLLNELAVQLERSGGFTIQGNMFAHGDVGIALLHSVAASQIFHNLFITPTTPAISDGISRWDDGISEGNYWSGYKGQDLDGDGIGDTPFMWLDHYPLMTMGYLESKPMKIIIDDLRVEIAALNLGKGNANSLFAKIDAAQKSFYKNDNIGAAVNQLQALINEINALKQSRRISSATAQQLFAKINQIIALMQQSDNDFDDLSYMQEKSLGTSPSSLDSDSDGMPDGWEAANKLNPTSAKDASGDLDGDGLSNLNEYLAFTRMPEFSDGSAASMSLSLIQLVEHFERRFFETNGNAAPQTAGTMTTDEFTNPNLSYVIASYVAQFHSVVYLLDSDGDGLSDFMETKYGTNPNNWDTDGDHMSDGWEVSYGFDPTLTVSWGNIGSIIKWFTQEYGDPDHDSIANRYEYWLTQMFATSSVNYVDTNPFQKDLVVQVDWAPSFEPNWTQLNVAKTPFSNHAINLHIIRGAELDSKYGEFSGTDPNDFYQARSNLLHADSRFDTVQSWAGLVRFAISVDNLGDGAGGSSGNAYDIPNDMYAFAHCANSGWVATCTSRSGIATTPEVAVAGTFMHELGHTLGLHHGGDVDTNYKMNYDSIMNYKYQITGTDVTGDHNGDGGTHAATEVVNYSDGSHGTGDFDDWTHVVNHLGDGITHTAP